MCRGEGERRSARAGEPRPPDPLPSLLRATATPPPASGELPRAARGPGSCCRPPAIGRTVRGLRRCGRTGSRPAAGRRRRGASVSPPVARCECAGEGASPRSPPPRRRLPARPPCGPRVRSDRPPPPPAPAPPGWGSRRGKARELAAPRGCVPRRRAAGRRGVARRRAFPSRVADAPRGSPRAPPPPPAGVASGEGLRRGSERAVSAGARVGSEAAGGGGGGVVRVGRAVLSSVGGAPPPGWASPVSRAAAAPPASAPPARRPAAVLVPFLLRRSRRGGSSRSPPARALGCPPPPSPPSRPRRVGSGERGGCRWPPLAAVPASPRIPPGPGAVLRRRRRCRASSSLSPRRLWTARSGGRRAGPACLSFSREGASRVGSLAPLASPPPL